MSVIVCGPQGCGKSTNAEAMRDYFKVSHIQDGWSPGERLIVNSLVITNADPGSFTAPGARIYSIKEVIQKLGAKFKKVDKFNYRSL